MIITSTTIRSSVQYRRNAPSCSVISSLVTWLRG